MLGYKIAENASKRVIITLEIPDDALTNMKRKSVKIKETAKYRCNRAFVVKIEDKEGNLYDTATSNEYKNKTLTYKVGELIEEPAFDTYLENVSPIGIHFFLNKRVAELYKLIMIQDGLFESWHDNGQKRYEVMYLNGHREGLYKEWYYNGPKSYEIMYKNGHNEGLFQSWHENGHKEVEVMYVNGKMEGLYEEWYENGQKRSEIMYKNGHNEGLFQRWYENGQKEVEVMYVNGKA